MFLARCLELTAAGGTAACVTPQLWLAQTSYQLFRTRLLKQVSWNFVSRLGTGAFGSIGGQVVNVALLSFSNYAPSDEHSFAAIDASAIRSVEQKASALKSGELWRVRQRGQLTNPDARVTLAEHTAGSVLGQFIKSTEGLSTGDRDRFIVKFWEQPSTLMGWTRFQTAPTARDQVSGTSDLAGC